jgi:hypothetical protein
VETIEVNGITFGVTLQLTVNNLPSIELKTEEAAPYESLLNIAFQGLDQSEAEAAWKPFLDFLAASPRDFVMAEAPKITAIPARHYWGQD